MKSFLSFLFSVALLSACAEQSTKKANQSNEPARGVTDLKGFHGLAVFESDYLSPGVVEFFRTSNFKETYVKLPVGVDTRLRQFKNTLYLIERSTSGVIAKVDLTEGERKTIAEFPKTVNLQDMLLLSDGRGWATGLASSDLLGIKDEKAEKDLNVNLNARKNRGQPFEAEKWQGFPESSYLLQTGPLVGVALQNLNSDFQPGEESHIAFFDTANPAAVRYHKLEKTNPVTEFRQTPGYTYIGCAGNNSTGTVFDGGVQRLNVDTLRPAGIVVTEEALYGDIADIEFPFENLGLAIVNNNRKKVNQDDPEQGSRLVAFDLKGTFAPYVIATAKPYEMTSMTWVPKQERLYLAEKNGGEPRVRVFDKDLKELPKEAIKLTLPPAQLLWID